MLRPMALSGPCTLEVCAWDWEHVQKWPSCHGAPGPLHTHTHTHENPRKPIYHQPALYGKRLLAGPLSPAHGWILPALFLHSSPGTGFPKSQVLVVSVLSWASSSGMGPVLPFS